MNECKVIFNPKKFFLFYRKTTVVSGNHIAVSAHSTSQLMRQK